MQLFILSYRGTHYVVLFTLLLLGGVGWCYFLKYFVRFLFGKPAMELTSNNLIDHQNGLKYQWSEITSLESTHLRFNFLAIKLVDNRNYIAKIKNPFIKFFLKLNSFFSSTPFRINLSIIRGSSEKSLNIIKDYHLKIINTAT